MLFKVTHIDAQGHRRKARVTARSTADAMEQADREWGDARACACVPMKARPVLHVAAQRADQAATPNDYRGGKRCAY